MVSPFQNQPITGWTPLYDSIVNTQRQNSKRGIAESHARQRTSAGGDSLSFNAMSGGYSTNQPTDFPPESPLHNRIAFIPTAVGRPTISYNSQGDKISSEPQMRTIGSPSQGYLTYKTSARRIDPLARECMTPSTPSAFSPWLKNSPAASPSIPSSAAFERPRFKKYELEDQDPQHVNFNTIGYTNMLGSPITKYREIKMPSNMSEYDFVPILEHSPRGRTKLARSSTTRDPASSKDGAGLTRARSLSPAKPMRASRFGKPEELDEIDDDYGIASFETSNIPNKRSKSPTKQMFGEKGWLHRDGESMNQLAGQKLKSASWSTWVLKVKQKADDTVRSFIESESFLTTGRKQILRRRWELSRKLKTGVRRAQRKIQPRLQRPQNSLFRSITETKCGCMGRLN